MRCVVYYQGGIRTLNARVKIRRDSVRSRWSRIVLLQLWNAGTILRGAYLVHNADSLDCKHHPHHINTSIVVLIVCWRSVQGVGPLTLGQSKHRAKISSSACCTFCCTEDWDRYGTQDDRRTSRYVDISYLRAWTWQFNRGYGQISPDLRYLGSLGGSTMLGEFEHHTELSLILRGAILGCTIWDIRCCNLGLFPRRPSNKRHWTFAERDRAHDHKPVQRGSRFFIHALIRIKVPTRLIKTQIFL
jgi:hypothetical protein